MTFYSIYISSKTEDQEENNKSSYVFSSMDEALKVLKSHKDGRLKTFYNSEDAINYAQTGYECTQVKYLDLKSPSATAEKAAFRAPTKHELIQFRKAIEDDKYDKVKNMIWDNPRYLINSGDTPTSLKDGYRYNALHICAIHKKANIAELILTTISNISFISLLHGKKNTKICEEVCEILLDYYLNMPEKGRSETPLHLAVKYGAVEVVEVLTTYPQCKMTPNLDSMMPKDIICTRMKNPAQETIDKIESLLQERFYVPVIRSVDNSIPPIIGQPFLITNPPDLNIDPLSPELEIQAYAGPMSKDQAQNFRKRWKTPPRVNQQSPNKSFYSNSHISPVKMRSSTPCQQNVNDNNHANNNILSSPINLPKKKLQFQETDLQIPENLKLSDDSKNGNALFTHTKEPIENLDNSINSYDSIEIIVSSSSPSHMTDLKQDENNGSNGKNCVQDNKFDDFKKPLPKMPKISFPLTPLRRDPKKKDLFYTYRDNPNSPLMLFDGNDSYVINNTSSPDCFLINKSIDDITTSPSLKERHVKLSDPEKGLESIGRELANEQQIEWKEYWDFLGCFLNIASDEGLEKLEEFLGDRKEGNGKSTFNQRNKEQVLMNNLCNALDKLDFAKENIIGVSTTSTINSIQNFEKSLNGNRLKLNNNSNNNANSGTISSQQTTPYLCVEKSLQVFAKRCTKTIIYNIDSVTSINDAFLSELKRLKSLICSFKDDLRFINVDFTIVHSRFANLIASYLKNSQDIDDNALFKIQQCFEQIIQSRIKVIDKGQSQTTSLVTSDKKEQLQCVAELILKFLINKDPIIQPENLKTEKICSETWLNEINCDCLWDTQLSYRQNNRKKRLEIYDDVSRKLFQDYGDQQEKLKDKTDTNASLLNLDELRKTNEVYSDVSTSSDPENSDDDVFVSNYNSETEEENFYTPPESPSILLDIDLLDLEDYHTYLLGNEPTKRDLDVINAIFNADININKYPNIYHWRAAVLRHSNEERDNFPSPSVIVKTCTESARNDNILTAKRLFMSPRLSSYCDSPTQMPIITPLSSPVSRFATENFLNYRDPNRNSIDSPITCIDGESSCVSKDLSFMNVSENS